MSSEEKRVFGRSWRTPDPLAELSDYDIDHLVFHLEKSGSFEDLHRLLALETPGGQNAWYVCNEVRRRPRAFADSIQVAWRISEGEYLGVRSNPPCDPQWGFRLVGRLCGYVLAASSVATVDSKMPSAFVKVLVEYDIWSTTRALEYARGRSSAYDRAEILCWLAPRLSEGLLREATSIAQDIDFYWARSKALTAIASQLPPERRLAVIQEAWCSATVHELHGDSLTRLAGLLPRALLAEATSAAVKVRQTLTRVELLSDLIPCWEPQDQTRLIEQLVDDVREIERNDVRAYALVRIARCSVGSMRRTGFQQALEIARGSDMDTTIGTIAWILPHLDEHAREPAIAIAIAAVEHLAHGHPNPDHLRTIAPYLSEESALLMWRIARRIDNDLERARTVSHIAPQLPKHLQGEAFSEAERIVEPIPNAGYQAIIWMRQMLSVDSSPLNLHRVRVILREVSETDTDVWVRDVLTILARLSREEARDLLVVTQTDLRKIDDEVESTRFMIGCIAYVQPVLLEELVSLVLHRSDSLVAADFGELFRVLGRSRIESPTQTPSDAPSSDCLIRLQRSALGHIQSERHRPEIAAIVTAVCPYLLADLHEDLFKWVLDLDSEATKREVLALIIPHLRPHVVRMATRSLLQLERIAEAPRRVSSKPLIALLRVVPPHQQRALIELFHFRLSSGTVEASIPEVLAYLSRPIRELLIHATLSQLKESATDEVFTTTLSAIGPFLSERSVTEALTVAEHWDLHAWETVLMPLVIRLTLLGKSRRAIGIVERHAHTNDSPKLLAAISKALIWQGHISKALRIAAALPGVEEISVLEELMSEGLSRQLTAFAIRELHDRIAQIEDASERAGLYSRLALCSPEKERSQLLITALRLLHQSRSQVTAVQLLARIPPPLLDDVFAESILVIRQLEYDLPKAHCIVALAPKCNPRQLGTLTDLAKTLGGSVPRAKAMAAIVPFTSSSSRIVLLKEVESQISHIEDPWDLVEVLELLRPQADASQCCGLLGDKIVALTAAQTWTETQDQSGAYFAGVLAEALPGHAFAIARGILEVKARADALANLASTAVRLPPSELIPILLETFHISASRNRQNLLVDLRELLPVVVAAHGSTSVDEIARAALKARRWWP